jgi:hypothetical protein
MKIVPIRILFVLMVFFVTDAALASGPSSPPPPTPPPGLPIDGGVMLLAIVAVFFGLYKVYQLKLNNKTPM